MKKVLYMIFSAVLFVAVSSCGKELVPQERPMEDGTVRVAIEPEFDGLEVDMKSLEIGETDILCYAYSGGTLFSGFPKKQSEVKDGIYFYDIPQNSTFRVFFTVYPEDVSLSYHYDTRYINDYDSPFYTNERNPTVAVCSKVDFKPTETQLKIFREKISNKG